MDPLPLHYLSTPEFGLSSVWHELQTQLNLHSALLIKSALLLLTGLCVHISLSPPNPPVKAEERCSGTEGTETMFEKIVQSITWCSKVMVWIAATVNIIAMLGQSLQNVEVDATVHPVLVWGTVLVFLAAVLRVWCFKSLGASFTFEISIRPKHTLITTGPYAIVRHPSYTGVYLTLFSATLVLLSPGTWIADVAIRTPLGLLVGVFWLAKCGYAYRGMVVRSKAEDSVLKDAFGDEWEGYMTKIKYRFVPGVY